MSNLSGKHIVLGVTGSIAAYKAAPLIRLLIKAGAEVQVVMTEAAREFITPLTLSTLSGRPVLCDFFDRTDGSWHSHVELGLWADLFLVAPATASTMAKMAYGIADNLLVTCYLATRGRVYVAPAMDLDMYSHPSTVASATRLREMAPRYSSPMRESSPATWSARDGSPNRRRSSGDWSRILRTKLTPTPP